jgi:hypothetical protein
MTVTGLPPQLEGRRPRVVTRYRVAVSLLLALAGGLAVLAAQSHPNPPPAYHDEVVRAVSPAPGSLGLRQDEIFVEIDPSYDGVISQVDQTAIPEDQLQRIPNLLRISYNPGQSGSETGRLSPGRHCARALFWRLGTPREQGRPFSWCFNLH